MPTLLLISTAALVLTGAALVIVGLRGRWLDRHPVCAGCKFDLVGLVPGAAKCPECGAGLAHARAVQVGNRTRRPVWMLTGLICLFAALGMTVWLLGSAARRLEIMSILPNRALVWLVAMDWQSQAVGVLSAQLKDHALSTSELADLAQIGLQVQRNPNVRWNSDWGNFIEAARKEGRLIDDDWRRYAEQAFGTMAVSCRETTAFASQLSATVQCSNFRVAFGSALHVRAFRVSVQFNSAVWRDGFPSAIDTYLYSASPTQPGNSFTLSSTPLRVPFLPGAYPLSVDAKIEVYDTPSTRGKPFATILRRVHRPSPVRVLPMGAELVQLVRDPALGPTPGAWSVTELQVMVPPKEEAAFRPGYEVTGRLSTTEALKTDIAMDVYLELPSGDPSNPGNNQRYKVSGFGMIAGSRLSQSGGIGQLPRDFPIERIASEGATVDVVFQPNRPWAESSASYQRIWGEPVVIRGVSVKVVPANQ